MAHLKKQYCLIPEAAFTSQSVFRLQKGCCYYWMSLLWQHLQLILSSNHLCKLCKVLPPPSPSSCESLDLPYSFLPCSHWCLSFFPSPRLIHAHTIRILITQMRVYSIAHQTPTLSLSVTPMQGKYSFTHGLNVCDQVCCILSFLSEQNDC